MQERLFKSTIMTNLNKVSRQSISAILLAAGLSRRMGKDNKLLLDIAGKAMVRNTAERILESGVSDLIVVVGHEAREVKNALRGLKCSFVENPDYEAGQMTSVHIGLESLTSHCDGIMICLADQPELTARDYGVLMWKYRDVPEGQVMVPMVKGQRGNPIILPSTLRDEILGGQLNFGCRQFIHKNPERTYQMEMGNDHFIKDIDTPEAYSELRADEKNRKLI